MKEHKKPKPNKIKVGYKTYDIIYTGIISPIIANYEPAVQGKCCPDEDKLHIFEHPLSEDAIRNTLLHEILHAIDMQMNTKLTEEQVVGITNGILSTGIDNKSIIKYLFKLN
jgi:hypothetical protein